jgi:hypothetical protein
LTQCTRVFVKRDRERRVMAFCIYLTELLNEEKISWCCDLFK